MQKKIIPILWNKFKIRIIKLYKYTYLILFTLSSINLYPNYNYKIYPLYSSKLAFNCNILYLYQEDNNKLQIKNVQIQKFNKFVFKNIIKNHILILNNQLNNFNTSINYLKNSGLIKKIKLILININDKKVFILRIYTNPILKKIIINDYKSLQIPKYFLINIFKSQIGLPKNFRQLNKSVHVIDSWYKNRGFKWSNILIIHNTNSQFFSLKITEGKIISTILKNESSDSILIKQKYKIEDRILKELNILHGNILNIKQIESGINYLKNIKLINTCTYKVIPEGNNCKLIINYTLLKNQIKLKYEKNILNKKNLYLHKSLQIFMPQLFLLYSYYKDTFLKLKNQIILLNKYLYFEYLSDASNFKNEKKFIFSIKILKKSLGFNIIIVYPSINIRNNIYINFLIYLYSESIIFIDKYPLQGIKIGKKDKLKYDKYNSRSNLKGIKILFKHYLSNNIYLNEKVNIIYGITKKSSMYLSKLMTTYEYEKPRNHNIYQLKIINKIIKQIIISLNIRLQYNQFYLNKNIKAGKCLLLDWMSNISLPFNVLHSIDKYKQSYQYIRFQYHQIVILPKYLNIISVNDNTFLLFLEINLNIGLNYNYIINKFSTQYSNYMSYFLPTTYRAIYYSKKSFLYHIEYNAYLNDYLSLYFFSNCYYNLDKTLYLKNSSLLYLQPNNNSSGYGLEVIFPINRIPPLRIEYGINNREENFFQLKAYSNFIEYKM